MAFIEMSSRSFRRLDFTVSIFVGMSKEFTLTSFFVSIFSLFSLSPDVVVVVDAGVEVAAPASVLISSNSMLSSPSSA